MKKRSQDQFTGKMFGRLWAPAIVSSLALAAADMADAIVVGQRMGAIGLAAISLALPVYMVINVFVYGLGIGGSVRYSKLLGEGRRREAQSCFCHIFWAALLGTLISLLAKSSKIWYNNGEFLLYTKEEVAHDSDMSK